MRLCVGQLRDVQRVESINVLLLQDAVKNSGLVDVRRQGQLNKNTMNIWV
jgi:hypothetical protein